MLFLLLVLLSVQSRQLSYVVKQVTLWLENTFSIYFAHLDSVFSSWSTIANGRLFLKETSGEVSIVFLPCLLKLSDFLALFKTGDLLLGERLLSEVDRIFTSTEQISQVILLPRLSLYLLVASVLMLMEWQYLSLNLNPSKQKV